jgi:hypothetical protein
MKELEQRTLCNSRVRDIKIDLLMGGQNPVIDLFCEITSGIEIINCHVYNEEGLEFIYHKDGQWIFYQDCKNEKFWTHYYKYWSFFESNFHLKYEEIQAITKVLVEEALKREVGTPKLFTVSFGSQVEEALKREVGTPRMVKGHLRWVVEEALKREVSPPTTSTATSWYSKLEEALKREVSTDKNT